jgi:hypothetical protein
VANVGDVLRGATVGALEYTNFGGYTLAVRSVGEYASGGLTPELTATQKQSELTVATYNVENLAPTNPQAKFDRLGAAVVANLRSPDVVVLEEIQDNNGATDDGTVAADVTLTKFVDSIVAAGGPHYQWRQIDPGKALGGASGGYVSGRAEIVEMLRQRSRPYLFSNSLAPSITAASIAALDLISSGGDLLSRLRENTAVFRSRMTDEGFDLLPGEHPIIPVMIGDAAQAGRMADLLLEQGIYVIGFSYPVVPHGKARIRAQMSAAHSTSDVNRAVDAFVAARAQM